MRKVIVSRAIKKKFKERRLRAITLHGAIEKSSLLLLQYWKDKQFDNTRLF